MSDVKACPLTWAVVAVTFGSWVIALAGIAGLQQKCDADATIPFGLLGVHGLSAGLECATVFRYYWFIISLQCVVVAGLAVTLASGCMKATRIGWVGILAIVTLLFIQTTDTFLTARDRAIVSDNGQRSNRTRTMIAGSLMVAACNMVLTFLVGMDDPHCGKCSGGKCPAGGAGKKVADEDKPAEATTETDVEQAC